MGPLTPLAWPRTGRVIFRSDKSGSSNLWVMKPDGSDRRQLTTNADVLDLGLCVSPDGQHIVFTSQRSGKATLWMVNSDGGNLTQLTDGEADAFPQCSPDGNWVVFQRGLFAKQTLWKIAYTGGPAFSTNPHFREVAGGLYNGRLVSYFMMADGKWQFAISSLGGPTVQSLVVPGQSGNVARWAPDDKALNYVSTVGSTGNIWSLPLDGTAPHQVTNFNSYSIPQFCLGAGR